MANDKIHPNFIKLWWRSIDQKIIFALVALFGFSAILVTTSGPAVASRIGLDENYFSTRQIIYLMIAAGLIILFSSFTKKWLKRIAILGFFVSIIFLILVRFYGYEVKGALRWVSIFGFSMQPSEFIKPFFATMIGWILSLKFEDNFPSFSVSLFFYLILAIFLIFQPDFGMFIMISSVFCLQLFVAGMPLFWIMFSIISSMFCVMGAYFFLPHVTKRINSFLDPDMSENYQVSKSLMAFSNGGFYGRGPGEGSVKQILPDSHTDFIFAVAGEELGAILCLAIICIFAFIVIRILLKLIDEKDKFIQLASIGIVTQFGLQSVINIGVSLNLLPTKGMTLPFISYGGCSTLTMGIAMGMLLAFTRDRSYFGRYKLTEIEI